MSNRCDVIMPEMGPSIAEGTITRWLVEVGARVERDQPLFEISTDKVDAEIPSPVHGVLEQIDYPVGSTIPVRTVVAWIATDPAEATRFGELPGNLSQEGRDSLSQTPPLDPPVDEPRHAGSKFLSFVRNHALWIGLSVYFVVHFLWGLYLLSKGEGGLHKPLLPAAFLLFGSAQLVKTKSVLLYKLLLLAGIVLLFASIVSLTRVLGARG